MKRCQFPQEFPQFEAGLSLMGVLPPARVVGLLEDRVVAGRARFGGSHSARCVLQSFDFGVIEPLFHAGRHADLVDGAALGPDGKLTTAKPKPYWQPGWLKQHDRLMAAMTDMKGRVPLVGRLDVFGR